MVAGDSAREQARRAREKSARLARYADNWEKGADGESHTAAALSHLGVEWTHIHDLRWPGRKLANIDHLAIGPGGIFVIDSKNWSGRITVKENVLRQNGYQRETEVSGCADAALAVGQLAPRYMDCMKPVICFDRDEEISGWAREVMLCSTANIVEMLMSRPRVLSDAEINHAATLLRRCMTTKARPRPSAQRAYSSRSSSPRSRRARQSFSPPRRPVAPPAPPVSRKKLSRFFVGLGIWFCLAMVIGATTNALALNPDVGSIAALLAGLVSWFLARRIVR